MSRGTATAKLIDASEAFSDDLNNARYAMHRIAQIQMKMSQCMDECLDEFKDLIMPQTMEATDPDHWINDVVHDLPKFMRGPE